MVEERVTERLDEAGNVSERVTERGTPATTIVERRGGGFGILMVLLIAVLAVGGYFLIKANSAQTEKDAAIAQAARDVGDSAKQVGASAEKAVDNLNQ